MNNFEFRVIAIITVFLAIIYPILVVVISIIYQAPINWYVVFLPHIIAVFAMIYKLIE